MYFYYNIYKCIHLIVILIIMGNYMAYGKDQQWIINNTPCETGTIILKKTSDINQINSKYGKVHGKLYKSIFGVEPDRSKLVGSGFAYYKDQWKFNSLTFNAATTPYHTDEKEMNQLEQKWIKKAILNWIQNDQTQTLINESIGIVNTNINNSKTNPYSVI